MRTFSEFLQEAMSFGVQRIDNKTGVIKTLPMGTALQMIMQETGEDLSDDAAQHAAQDALSSGQPIKTSLAKYQRAQSNDW